MKLEKKLSEMGIILPEVPKPVAAYVPAVLIDNYVYTSGQLPFENGQLNYKGKAGTEVTEQAAYEAAKISAINCLAAIKGVIGDLDKIEKVVKVVGFVNSESGFTMQPKVINGASEFIGQLLGDKGAHARSAVGVSELPLGAVCEVEMIVKIKR